MGKELVRRGGGSGPDLNMVVAARGLVMPGVIAEVLVARAVPRAEAIFLLMHQPGNYSVELLTQGRELTSCSLAGISSRWIIVLCASTNKEVDLKSYQLMFPRGPTPRSLR